MSASEPSTPTTVAFEVLNEIGIIAQLSGNRLERLVPDGISLAGFGVLNNFVRLGGTRTPAGLARAFQVTKGAMTNTLQRLQAKGLVELSPDPDDGRVKRVVITDEGRRVRDVCLQRIAPSVSELAEALTDAELASLLPGLKQLRVWLDENR